MSQICYKKKLGLKVRQIGEQFFLVDFLTTYKVNETTLEIIKQCDGRKKVDQIVQHMIEKYPKQSVDAIKEDVKEIINKFKDVGLITAQ